MAIEADILEIKAMLIEQNELLRKIAGVRVAPMDDDCEFDKSSAAEYCGISRATLDKYAKEIGLSEHYHEGRVKSYYLKGELDAIIRIKRLQRKAKH